MTDQSTSFIRQYVTYVSFLEIKRIIAMNSYCSTFVEYIAHSLLLLLLEIVCTTCVQLDKRKIAAQLLMLEFIGRKWKKEERVSVYAQSKAMRALHQ